MRRIAALTRNPVIIALVGVARHRRLRLEEDAEQRRRSRPRRGAQRPARRRTSPSMSATASSSTPIPRRSAPTRRRRCPSRRSGSTSTATTRITVEGHADERGTREYNLALGARRAAATRDFLIARGVAAQRLKTISYGKERPVAVCDDISCWSRTAAPSPCSAAPAAEPTISALARSREGGRGPPFAFCCSRKQNLAEVCGLIRNASASAGRRDPMLHRANANSSSTREADVISIDH